MDVITLTGTDLQAVLPALSELRIQVFREWPYLYEGTLEAEQKYLKKFSAAKGAVIIVARDGNKIVGTSTASPLLGHADVFAYPFAIRGYEPERIFYFGESVLLPEYRGHGIGHKFFDERERQARSSGQFDIASFCGVVRDGTDPRKPTQYRPLDEFWRKRGFEKEEGLVTELPWKEPDNEKEIVHKMQFWIKKL